MNCVLHFLEKQEDISIVENNYDRLYPIVKDQFLFSFLPNQFPNRNFIQIFCKKLEQTDISYSKYLFLYQVNRFIQSKNYKRLIYIESNMLLKNELGLSDLINEVNAFGPDFIRFTKNDEIYESFFIGRVSLLDSNLDYANCSYETYSQRQQYNSYDVYTNTPFIKTLDIERYVS